MIKKKDKNLTASTLTNFGIIFYELEFLVILQDVTGKYFKGFKVT